MDIVGQNRAGKDIVSPNDNGYTGKGATFRRGIVWVFSSTSVDTLGVLTAVVKRACAANSLLFTVPSCLSKGSVRFNVETQISRQAQHFGHGGDLRFSDRCSES